MLYWLRKGNLDRRAGHWIMRGPTYRKGVRIGWLRREGKTRLYRLFLLVEGWPDGQAAPTNCLIETQRTFNSLMKVRHWLIIHGSMLDCLPVYELKHLKKSEDMKHGAHTD